MSGKSVQKGKILQELSQAFFHPALLYFPFSSLPSPIPHKWGEGVPKVKLSRGPNPVNKITLFNPSVTAGITDPRGPDRMTIPNQCIKRGRKVMIEGKKIHRMITAGTG